MTRGHEAFSSLSFRLLRALMRFDEGKTPAELTAVLRETQQAIVQALWHAKRSGHTRQVPIAGSASGYWYVTPAGVEHVRTTIDEYQAVVDRDIAEQEGA